MFAPLVGSREVQIELIAFYRLQETIVLPLSLLA